MKVTAPVIARESDIAWWVECHGGCGRTITVARRSTAPDGTVTELTAPEPRRCACCGPFPR